MTEALEQLIEKYKKEQHTQHFLKVIAKDTKDEYFRDGVLETLEIVIKDLQNLIKSDLPAKTCSELNKVTIELEETDS